jgi:hypothetical protein
MRLKENDMNYRLISSIVHELIAVADSTIHDNECPDKDKCATLLRIRKRLYAIREEVLDLIIKEEENGHQRND